MQERMPINGVFREAMECMFSMGINPFLVIRIVLLVLYSKKYEKEKDDHNRRLGFAF
jgi:hypothetical protein